MEEVTTVPKKILVVDDDREIRAATLRLLTRTGCQVFEAENGVRGLEATLAIRPDLILSDVAMPELERRPGTKSSAECLRTRLVFA
jgi:CheY-like chemotaxis protein